MGGVTGILNGNAPEGKKLSVFFNTNLGNVALEQRNETESTDSADLHYTASSTDQPGYILTDSNLATTNLQGVTLVFGMTQQYSPPLKGGASKDCNCNDPTYNDVSIVSPIYRSLTKTNYGNNAIAACCSDDSAYVFYVSGAEGETLTLTEETLGEDTPQTYEGTQPIQPGSSLAAYYDPDADVRYCIYQSDVHLWEISSQASNNQVTYPTVEKDSPTPLAVVYVVDSKKAYLYYRTNDKHLRKCVKASGVWGSEMNVKNAHKVADDSQITATYDGKHIHLFYVADGETPGGGKFEHTIDKEL